MLASIAELSLNYHQESKAFPSRCWIRHSRVFLQRVVYHSLTKSLLEKREAALLVIVGLFFQGDKVPLNSIFKYDLPVCLYVLETRKSVKVFCLALHKANLEVNCRHGRIHGVFAHQVFILCGILDVAAVFVAICRSYQLVFVDFWVAWGTEASSHAPLVQVICNHYFFVDRWIWRTV